MSFYMGGQRFKSRPAPVSQPPQIQPPVNNPDGEMHPLRSHTVSQESSPSGPTRGPVLHTSVPQQARTRNKPPISVDTSPAQPSRPSFVSPDTPGDGYSPTDNGPRKSRKGSVPDRSPLQRLEQIETLGDLTKEEKRTRAEEAERNLRTGRQGSMNSRSIPRKPVGATNGGARRSRTQTSSHTNNGYGSADDIFVASSGRKYRKTSLGLEPFPSRDRAVGYDSSRGTDAAAAAIGAYQTGRKLSRDDNTPIEEYCEPATQSSLDNSRPIQTSEEQMNGEARSTGNRDPLAIPESQRQLQTDRLGPKGGASAAKKTLADDALSRRQVHNTCDTGATYSIPPQTASGQEARELVGPPDEHSTSEGPSHEIHGGRGGRLKFSQVIHPISEGPGRRFKDVDYLEDWRTAATGTITASELDLNSTNDQQAWWEREKGSRRSSNSRNVQSQFAAGPYEDESGRTAFNPPLTLRCGPLLRYTGIREDMGQESSQARKFWRGSVMILTENATSSDEAPPILRLFKQSMDLYTPQPPDPTQPPVTQINARKDDPIAGQTKCDSKGGTLYVNHVSKLARERDLSQIDGEDGLFTAHEDRSGKASRLARQDGEKIGRYKEVKGHRLHVERGLTFWRFNIEVELEGLESRIAYRINNGPAIGFWVPAKNQSMNIMFHSCNGFSLSVDSNKFSGPDPLWRDVLNAHQQKPFHVMIGGGDQIYNDAAQRDTHYFQEWLRIKNPEHKYTAPFSEPLQDELERFYLQRYAMWFSSGLFGLANSQIPMVNIWDDHDIIDGYGSYAHHFMSCPVFTGLGAVAFKYYMLFQHQSVPAEDSRTEPSWIRGASRGPYINQFSRSVYMSLGQDVAFVGLDCRTERLRDEVLSDESYKIILDRLDNEIQEGGVKHLIVLLGIPIAYPRMTFAENILTSRAVDPVKAIARTGVMGGFLNKFDGSVEVLDDLDDHWTAKHHKVERSWLIEDLQGFAAEKSVRITILGGDVHLAAVGQFYSKRKLGIPKDRDHRYMPNIISSAIVNTPPPENLADFLNKRNKIHHLDDMTDEDMIPLFTYDVNGKARNNHHLLPRRNYCVIRPYNGDPTPPASVFDFDEDPAPRRRRSFSFGRRNSSGGEEGERRPSLLRRLSNRVAPPSSFREPADGGHFSYGPHHASTSDPRFDVVHSAESSRPSSQQGSSAAEATSIAAAPARRDSFLRRPNIGANSKSWAKDPTGREGHIDLSDGLEVVIHCEVNQKDPAGKTMPYRLIIPALTYHGHSDHNRHGVRGQGVRNFLGSLRRTKQHRQSVQGMPYEINEPATPAVEGDQRYTTMMENHEKEALAAAKTKHTDPAAAAHALDGLAIDRGPQQPNQALRERATLDSLPRSGVIETEIPAGVPAYAYHEQRRGSLEQNRGHDFVGRSRSSRGRNDSVKKAGTEAEADLAGENQQDRAYWGAQQVRGEVQSSQPLPAKRTREKGLRRYYASPFGSEKRHDYNPEGSPPLPTTGLDPPLGRVNNRVDVLPNEATNSINQGTNNVNARRVVSDPTQNAPRHRAQASTSNAYRHNNEPEITQQKNQRPQEKDPYAYYLPEAVEAEFQSEDEISELEPDMSVNQHHAYDAVSEASSIGSQKRKSRNSYGHNHRESFASAQTNTSLAHNRGRADDSPLYSDEDDLDHMENDRLTPEPPPRSPDRKRRSTPQSRPLSKVERLTGASASGQRASYASGSGFDEDGLPLAMPVGQGASGKAAKMLGADLDEDLQAFNGNGMSHNQSNTSGGRFGGLVRRLSGRGSKAKRRMSGGI